MTLISKETVEKPAYPKLCDYCQLFTWKNCFALKIEMNIWKTLHFYSNLPLSYDEPDTYIHEKKNVIHINTRLLEKWVKHDGSNMCTTRIIIHFRCIYICVFIYFFVVWLFTPHAIFLYSFAFRSLNIQNLS